MSDAISDLRDWERRIRALKELPKETAALAAPLVEAAVKATAAAGTDPFGVPWTPKKDGGRPMVNAAAAVSAKAIGPIIQVKLTGVEVYHQYSKSHPRKVIPEGGGSKLPPSIHEAIDEAALKAFHTILGGGS